MDKTLINWTMDKTLINYDKFCKVCFLGLNISMV